MTDTQEAMRADMERSLSLYREELETDNALVLDEDMENAFRDGFVDGFMNATAQSAEKIAKLEAEKAMIQKVADDRLAIMQLEAERLAAAELSNKQLRESLFAAQGFIHNGIELGYIRMPNAGTPDPAHETPRIIAEALIQPISTEALDAYVAKRVSEQRELMDREIRRCRRFYFHTLKNSQNTALAQIFNDLLLANRTFELDIEKSEAREVLSRIPELKDNE